MDNQIVSTTYVPLPPPYQIIKYLGDMAMQIGTLIVTIQKEGNANGTGYQIETRSHPVVAYEKKEQARHDRQLATYQPLEGTVWDYVEVKHITTVCLSNSCLPWKEFIEFLWRDLDQQLSTSHPAIWSYWMLNKLCKGIERPEKSPTVVELTIHFAVREDRGAVLCSTPKSPLALNVPISKKEVVLAAKDEDAVSLDVIENCNEILKDLRYQLQDYHKVLTHLVGDISELNYTFHCGIPRFRKIADRLNEEWKWMTYAYRKHDEKLVEEAASPQNPAAPEEPPIPDPPHDIARLFGSTKKYKDYIKACRGQKPKEMARLYKHEYGNIQLEQEKGVVSAIHKHLSDKEMLKCALSTFQGHYRNV